MPKLKRFGLPNLLRYEHILARSDAWLRLTHFVSGIKQIGPTGHFCDGPTAIPGDKGRRGFETRLKSPNDQVFSYLIAKHEKIKLFRHIAEDHGSRLLSSEVAPLKSLLLI